MRVVHVPSASALRGRWIVLLLIPLTSSRSWSEMAVPGGFAPPTVRRKVTSATGEGVVGGSSRGAGPEGPRTAPQAASPRLHPASTTQTRLRLMGVYSAPGSVVGRDPHWGWTGP